MSDITTLMMAAAGGAAAEETDENFNQTVLLLHGDGTNGAQNNTFLDSSTNNFTITRNGNTTQGTFSPFSAPDGRWSNYFAGDDSSVRFASTASYGVGTGNFTVELWANFSSIRTSATATVVHNRFYAQGVSGTDGVVFDYISSSAGNGLQIGIQNTYPINIYSWTPEVGRWYHIALVRSGTGTNQVALYIDGVSVATGTSAGNVTANNINIGSIEWATSWGFNGYISNVRFSNTARTITVPTGPYSDDANTLLLTCQSNRFVDNATPANTTVSTFATAPKVTPFSPFAPTAAYSAGTNGGSGYFDGTGDHLVTASDADFTLSGDFTISAWVYRTVGSTNTGIFTTNPSVTNTGVGLVVTSSNILQLRIGPDASVDVLSDPTALPLNTWVYVGATRSGTTTTLYRDGVAVATGSSSKTPNTTSGVIGRYYSDVDNFYFYGYISNVKVVKGVATALTSVPTSPLTSDANTSLLLNFTNAGIFDQTGKNNLETVADAQIDTTTKKYGTGSMEFDGTGDYLLLPATQDLAMGTGDFTIEMWVNLSATGASDGVLVEMRSTGASTTGFVFNTRPVTSPSTGFKLNFYTDGGANLATTILAYNTWHHVAVTRASGTVRLFANGTSDITPFTKNNNFSDKPNVTVGQSTLYSSSNITGFVDDLRITKGVARYTTTFSVPTKAFPDL